MIAQVNSNPSSDSTSCTACPRAANARPFSDYIKQNFDRSSDTTINVSVVICGFFFTNESELPSSPGILKEGPTDKVFAGASANEEIGAATALTAIETARTDVTIFFFTVDMAP
ncbi:hypothetical protein NLX71_25465 [Paenibacillus sp. MZ04-78.2]|uniref:hypothetical protein n=1 Tax=Paenibacillus sp. MZ04-78.2 TaxID=2962034 RepID=UPI0020B7D1C3|nr:hypothetical protein [Paenibacillus sp. MZ04-78.2]MCP3776598.1 hypothetical protein [Paenibacillus sp. MZ04-78.2]